MSAFIIDGLTLERGGVELFNHLGVTLLPGAMLAIRGGNGSGKTTLLRRLAGLFPASVGNVSLKNGVYPSGDVIYLGHDKALDLRLTVAQELRRWAALFGTTGSDAAAIRYYGLEPYRNILCGKLSAGWRVRVALARVMCGKRRIWLLDEPDAHLDVDGRKKFMHAASSRCYNGGIVIFSCHGDAESLRSHAFMPLAELRMEDFAA